MSVTAGKAPGPVWISPLSAARLRRDPLAWCTDAARRFGDLVRFQVGPLHFYLVFHPHHLQHVLAANHRNYVKGALLDKTKVLIGDGLSSSEGNLWRRQRRLAQPAFHADCLERFGETTADTTAAMLTRWQPSVGAAHPLDVGAEMSRLTLDVVGKVLFSLDLSGEAARAGRSLRTALDS